MTDSTLRVRRATVEDLDALRPLWTAMNFPVAELEPRLTEFQIVENTGGNVVGAVGFQIGASHGRMHSEVFSDLPTADEARKLLWKRIQTLSANHGILRVWTREESPYWDHIGFTKATEEELKRLPTNWNSLGIPWLTFQLKNEAAIDAVEKELAVFMGAQKQNSERIIQQVKTLKVLATFIAIIFAIIAFAAAFYLVMKRPDILHPGR